MLDAILAIIDRTQGLTAEDYAITRVVRDAAQWNFCVIGEALTQLKKRDVATASRITDQAKIIGLRNQLIHGYGAINNDIPWRIIVDKLPILRRELEQPLAEKWNSLARCPEGHSAPIGKTCRNFEGDVVRLAATRFP